MVQGESVNFFVSILKIQKKGTKKKKWEKKNEIFPKKRNCLIYFFFFCWCEIEVSNERKKWNVDSIALKSRNFNPFFFVG